MARGDDLWVETTDQLAVIDIPHMCREDGNVLVAVVPTEFGHRFHIRKA